MSDDLSVEARRESFKLGLALKQYIRESGGTAAEVSRKLGRAAQYLTRVFSGILPLRIEEMFGVFEILGKHPQAFFGRHYPLARAKPDLQPRPSGPAREEPAHLMAYLDSALATPLPPRSEMVLRAGRRLKGLIVRAGTRQRTVSLRLGLTRDALGQALRGNSDLAAWHVFGVLAATNTSAAQFFHELIGPDDPASSSASRLDDLVVALERALTSFVEHQRPEPAPVEPESKRSRRRVVRRSKAAKPRR